MKSAGVIRPWQCGWRADFSLSGMVDPEVALNLMEVICVEGLLGLNAIAMLYAHDFEVLLVILVVVFCFSC